MLVIFLENSLQFRLHSRKWISKVQQIQQRNPLIFFAKSARSQFSTRQRTPLSTASAGRTRPSENPTWVKHLAKTACKLSCKRLPVMSSNQQRASKMCISTNRAKLGKKKTIPRDSDSLEAKYTTSSAPRCWEKLIRASTSHTALHCNFYWRPSRNSTKLIEFQSHELHV